LCTGCTKVDWFDLRHVGSDHSHAIFIVNGSPALLHICAMTSLQKELLFTTLPLMFYDSPPSRTPQTTRA
jgi:hypothetical protein